MIELTILQISVVFTPLALWVVSKRSYNHNLVELLRR